MSTLNERGRQAGGRRKQQKEETARAIKEAALAVFRERGFAAATTANIAQEAGVAHGTVFSVAPTKEALLVLALEEKLREVALARIAELPRKKKLKSKLHHLFGGLFEFYAADRELSRLLARGILFFNDAIAQAKYELHVGELQKLLTALFEQARESDEIGADVDPQRAASNVVAIYFFALLSFLNAPEPDAASLNTTFRQALDALFAGIPGA